jgi:hypothetical protein
MLKAKLKSIIPGSKKSKKTEEKPAETKPAETTTNGAAPTETAPPAAEPAAVAARKYSRVTFVLTWS